MHLCCRMSSISSPASGSLQIKWDPKNLEIRTKSVEKTLEPLVTQVTFCWLFFIFLFLAVVITGVNWLKLSFSALLLTNEIILVVAGVQFSYIC